MVCGCGTREGGQFVVVSYESILECVTKVCSTSSAVVRCNRFLTFSSRDAQGRCAELARRIQTKLDTIKSVKSDLGTVRIGKTFLPPLHSDFFLLSSHLFFPFYLSSSLFLDLLTP